MLFAGLVCLTSSGGWSASGVLLCVFVRRLGDDTPQILSFHTMRIHLFIFGRTLDNELFILTYVNFNFIIGGL